MVRLGNNGERPIDSRAFFPLPPLLLCEDTEDADDGVGVDLPPPPLGVNGVGGVTGLINDGKP
jgi:hypothetical protein